MVYRVVTQPQSSEVDDWSNPKNRLLHVLRRAVPFTPTTGIIIVNGGYDTRTSVSLLRSPKINVKLKKK